MHKIEGHRPLHTWQNDELHFVSFRYLAKDFGNIFVLALVPEEFLHIPLNVAFRVSTSEIEEPSSDQPKNDE